MDGSKLEESDVCSTLRSEVYRVKYLTRKEFKKQHLFDTDENWIESNKMLEHWLFLHKYLTLCTNGPNGLTVMCPTNVFLFSTPCFSNGRWVPGYPVGHIRVHSLMTALENLPDDELTYEKARRPSGKSKGMDRIHSFE